MHYVGVCVCVTEGAFVLAEVVDVRRMNMSIYFCVHTQCASLLCSSAFLCRSRTY